MAETIIYKDMAQDDEFANDDELLVSLPYSFVYANAAARTGASGFDANDVGKLARQTDEDSLWMLTAVTPTWKNIDTVGGSSETVSEDFTQATHGFAVGDVLRYASGSWTKALADTGDNAEALGVVSAVPNANDFTIVYSGRITGLSGLTADSTHFLSDSVSGALTTTSPVISKPILYATSTTEAVVLILRGMTGSADASNLIVKDEGSQLTASAVSMDFVGSRVTVTEPTTDNILVTVANEPSATTTTQGIVELATNGETASGVVVQGNDSRLVDKVYRYGHTYAITGEIAVPSGDTDFIIPFFVSLAAGQTASLVKARHKINSGTSATCKIQKNDVDVTGFTGISVTTTAANTDPANVALANDDKLALVVTGVSGTPKNLSFTIFIEMTQ